ncbi:ABC transporter ATP-binding protein [Flavobacterium xinjiangense]|uniref:ABC-type multidrug transport system, ATPase component n=1 Tax=Flavobacterium xinjiangense TaxID=178356 RepID=A0A1M7P819_9FLAO|nr:ABC transporter ATP-binding protein [Flavobacterium xinjiangense]SHN12797.1 ABC-type multidrug transport system, ATPase component [Flavobacterium xinjiangense]
MKLEIKNISKQYDKNKFGLQNFSMTIENGILGLLGPNGAGKSTLMKIIATISNPTSGQILLDGIDITKKPNQIRKILGYLPQDFGVYPNLNAYEFLEYIAAMKGIGGTNLKDRISQLLEGVNLTDAAKKPIGTYSGGMKQRIGIAQVLLNDPKVLIFDEPTVGLDPEERVRFRNLISDLANDCIVILSSHIVSDIETIADKVAIMQNGKLISQGYQQDIIDAVKNKVFELEIDKNALNEFKTNHLILNTVRKKENILVRFVGEVRPVNATLCNATLEDAYLFHTKK